MPFVKGKWEEIKGPDYKTKFRVTKNDITLNYTLSRAVRDTYKVEFTIIIVPKALVKPEEQIDREVYKNSLKEAILANIDNVDRKYMKLHDFNGRKAVFYFDWRTWFKDAIKGKPRTYLSKFQRVVDFKKRIPRMIAYQTASSYFPDFLTKKFKEFIIKKRLIKPWLSKVIPQKFFNQIRGKLENMYDYDYDIQHNRMIIKLKTPYILGFAYAVGKSVDKLKNDKRRSYMGVDFRKNIKSNMKKMRVLGLK